MEKKLCSIGTTTKKKKDDCVMNPVNGKDRIPYTGYKIQLPQKRFFWLSPTASAAFSCS